MIPFLYPLVCLALGTVSGAVSWWRAAVLQARNFRGTGPNAVCVCWDLDNTLVASGALLRRGRTLEEAILEAYPVDNMLDFYAAMRMRLPEALHFILSARSASMRDVPTFDRYRNR